MDGIPSANFPAPLAPPNQQFTPPQPPAESAPTKAVGRPSADPEQQQQREARSHIKRRMESALPKEMREPRIAIYRLVGRKGLTKANPRPVITILLSDLEKAQNEGTEASDFIRNQIEEKYPSSKHRYLWEAQDHKGNTLPDFGKFEIDMRNEDDLDDDDAEFEDEEDVDERELEMRAARNGDPWTPRPPAHGQPLDPAAHARQIRSIVENEHKREERSTSMLLQMMMQQQETRRMEEAARMEREERRREDERREAKERAEREERRREEERRDREREIERKEAREREERRMENERQMQFMKMMMDASNKPDVAMPMVMKMLESKSDRDGTKELFQMFTNASNQSMLMQGEASKHMMAAQAEASKLLISNILGISKQMVEAQIEATAPGHEDDDPMDKIARMFKLFAPAISAIGGGANAQQNLIATQQQMAQQTQPAQQPAQRQQARQQAPVSRKTNPEIPDAEWIKGGLTTIMQLETGAIPVQQRFPALKWCAENLPERMLTAIRAGDENTVLQIGQEGADEAIIQWLFSAEENMQFLRDCVTDIRHLLLNTITEDLARQSVEKQLQHQQMKNGQPFPKEKEVTAEVVKEEKPRPPAKRSAPPPKDVPIAVDETKPVEEKKDDKKPEPQNTAPGSV